MKRPAFIEGQGSVPAQSADEFRTSEELLEAVSELKWVAGQSEVSAVMIAPYFTGALHLAQGLLELHESIKELDRVNQDRSRLLRLSAFDNIKTCIRLTAQSPVRSSDGEELLALQSFNTACEHALAAARSLALFSSARAKSFLLEAAVSAVKGVAIFRQISNSAE